VLQGCHADPVVCSQLIYAGKVLKDTTILVKDLVKVSFTAASSCQVFSAAAANAALGAAVSSYLRSYAHVDL
jgi:hypothetical protein